MAQRLIISNYQPQLAALGLTSISAIKRHAAAETIGDHHGRRDIVKLISKNADGSPLVMFLKRVWTTPAKNDLASLLRGRLWSVSRVEWENFQLLRRRGFATAEPVAVGEERTLLRQTFSFIITRAADGNETIEDFLKRCTDRAQRRIVFDALARHVKAMHDAGLFSPDLFTRHLFLDRSGPTPKFCLIDMARLDHNRSAPPRLRVRDLAALNITAPLRNVSKRERIRFLRLYSGHQAQAYVQPIRNRLEYLLKRSKYRSFET